MATHRYAVRPGWRGSTGLGSSAMMPDGEQPMRLTRIDLRPTITVRGDVARGRIEHLVEVAHRECFIASSLSTEMVIEPTIVFEGV
jgi:organic hydroperoxide reductase OsmC/OhrA